MLYYSPEKIIEDLRNAHLYVKAILAESAILALLLAHYDYMFCIFLIANWYCVMSFKGTLSLIKKGYYY